MTNEPVTARQIEVAALNPKALNAFINLLFSAVATVATEQVNKALANQATALLAQCKGLDAELGIDVMPTLMRLVKTGQVDEVDLTNVVRDIKRAVRLDVVTDTSVGHSQLDMLKAALAYLNSRNEVALRKLITLAPETDNSDLISALTFKPSSQKEFTKPLEKIVLTVAKRKGQTLTAEELKALKTKSPKIHGEYLRLRKEFNNVWKDELRNLINNAGRPMVDFQYAIEYLASQDVKNPLPKTYEGLVDSNGKFYTKAGKAIATVPGPGFSIKMNPAYDPKKDDTYVFITINDNTGEQSQYVYTADYRKKATVEKFEKVRDLDAVIGNTRKKWMASVKAGTPNDPKVVTSTLIELLYLFSARVGTTGNATDGKPTFGLTTLTPKHIKVAAGKMTITYLGKKGVKQVHVLTTQSQEGKWLFRNVQQCLEGKEPNDRVFTFLNGGRTVAVTSAVVNKLLKHLTGSDITAHKLRHVRGTQAFRELLEANKAKIFPATLLTQAQAEKMFLELAKGVGLMLGHVKGVGPQQKVTPMTAIANYIDPRVMVGYFQALNLRPPKFLMKFDK
jgi:hypothetical protein